MSDVALEFLLERSKTAEAALASRKSHHSILHYLKFMFKGNNELSGFAAFDPYFLKIISGALPRYRVFDYLDKRSGHPIGNTAARVVSETSAELLYHSGALEKAVSASYPKIKLSSEEKSALKRISSKISAQVEDCHGLLESLQKTVISGEKIVDFLLNEQGKFCPLDFYSCLEDPGIKFADMIDQYFEPSGVWKGILLRHGYIPYRVDNHTIYFNAQVEVVKDAVKIKPF